MRTSSTGPGEQRPRSASHRDRSQCAHAVSLSTLFSPHPPPARGSRPGSYDVSGVRSGHRRSMPTAQHGFSVSKRGAELEVGERGDLPGPGAYDPYETAAAARRFQGLDKKAAFNSNTDRFKRLEDQPTANLGPGAYVDVRYTQCLLHSHTFPCAYRMVPCAARCSRAAATRRKCVKLLSSF